MCVFVSVKMSGFDPGAPDFLDLRVEFSFDVLPSDEPGAQSRNQTTQVSG
jgi:hypothetical protein